jgi:hypothetical protein
MEKKREDREEVGEGNKAGMFDRLGVGTRGSGPGIQLQLGIAVMPLLFPRLMT